MNFFKLQNKLFYTRKIDREPIDTESEQSFVPYMHNRWLSFYSKEMAIFTNETLNKFSEIFEDKQDTYRLYYNIIPQLKFKRISYTKKIKKEEVKENEDLKVAASNRCMSVRELKQLLDLKKELNK